ncbi:hypothetical protein ZTR_02587 [Talaromyces verruculosus]|nr:hypothetical protein ZTR_02587 [Talaromyces verruculosus]
MASTVEDFKIAGVAAGFTLGYGFWTVWKAFKQTSVIRAPHRSTYVYLIWGEIVANIIIGIIGWLFLEGVIPLGVPVLFSLLFCWVFEIQLLMQIIINRVYVVAENQRTVIRVRWITAGIITAINIAVFCIWIPAHLNPPANELYPVINKYWDRTSKVLICIVDAALNYWFLRIVQRRLVRYHGLKKYAPLVNFNAWLMALSVSLDVMLIGLMSLKNQLVYIQFHPVTYMVKLNIEMTMAAMITKLAREPGTGDTRVVLNSSQDQYRRDRRTGLQLSDIDLDRCSYPEDARQNHSHVYGPGHEHKAAGALAGINKETTIHVMTQHAFSNSE